MLQELPAPITADRHPIVLRTERLTLRRPTLADVKEIAEIVADKRVAINLRRVPHPYVIDDAIAFVTGVAAAAQNVLFLIESADIPVGLAGIHRDHSDAPELGYCFGIDHWGKGFATEAARAVIDYAFEELEIDQLLSSSRISNPASRHVLEKCGFQWKGVELHRFTALGSSTPVDCFKLERSVWASIRNWGGATRVA